MRIASLWLIISVIFWMIKKVHPLAPQLAQVYLRRRGCPLPFVSQLVHQHTPPSGLRPTVQSHGIKQYLQKNVNELQYKIISSTIKIAVGQRPDGNS